MCPPLNNHVLVAGSVRLVVERILGQSLELTDMETPLRSLGLDSAAMIDLILALESELKIQIHDQDILPEHFRSLSSIVKYVEGKAQ